MKTFLSIPHKRVYIENGPSSHVASFDADGIYQCEDDSQDCKTLTANPRVTECKDLKDAKKKSEARKGSVADVSKEAEKQAARADTAEAEKAEALKEAEAAKAEAKEAKAEAEAAKKEAEEAKKANSAGSAKITGTGPAGVAK